MAPNSPNGSSTSSAASARAKPQLAPASQPRAIRILNARRIEGSLKSGKFMLLVRVHGAAPVTAQWTLPPGRSRQCV
jgi:hypothetical protein